MSATDALVLVPLRDGPTVPSSVIAWLIAAEDRGLHFAVEAGGQLRVGPRTHIHHDDDAFIRAHRAHLIACVTYIERLYQEPV